MTALTGLGAAPAAVAADVTVAVAANFVAPLEAIASDFRAASGHTVVVVAGATGKLYSQIAAGAPFDVLLAADAETPARLIADRHAVTGSAFTYAIGRLALWSAVPGLVDAGGAVLAQPRRFRHLALANPRLAPYGRAAMEVLDARGLFERLRPTIVMGQNIAQTYQFVVSGNAELGFVALSQVRAPGRAVAGSWWEVPTSLHAPIRQDAVLLAHGAANPAARALLEFLRSDAARARIRAFGYGDATP
ncbi:MAG: molybdate ABC transporter substrate-binding protein [Rubrivivax sp.]